MYRYRIESSTITIITTHIITISIITIHIITISMYPASIRPLACLLDCGPRLTVAGAHVVSHGSSPPVPPPTSACSSWQCLVCPPPPAFSRYLLCLLISFALPARHPIRIHVVAYEAAVCPTPPAS
eukprot:GHVU01216106.1.p1 GENE.GHVU01216106.1~~GHVU01216106.1.p1  ORF type:complete len:126 (-),score=11.97 GHVU01216106.1:59-436(-)